MPNVFILKYLRNNPNQGFTYLPFNLVIHRILKKEKEQHRIKCHGVPTQKTSPFKPMPINSKDSIFCFP